MTNEDKELLQRWAKMQQANVPIAPKPIVEGRGQGQTASVLSNPSHNKANNTNSGQVKKVSSDSAIHSQDQVYYGSERRVQQGTLDLLQQRILGNNSVSTLANPSTHRHSIPFGKDSMCALGGQEVSNNRLSLGCTPIATVSDHRDLTSAQQMLNRAMPSTSQQMADSRSCVTQSSGNFSVDFSNVPMNELPNVTLGDIDFLSMMPSPEIANILAQNISNDLQQNTLSPRQNFNDVQDTRIYSRTDYNQATFSSQSATNDFIESLCSEAASVDTRRTSDTFVPLDLPHNKSPNTLSVSPNFQNRVSPTAQYLTASSPGSHHSNSPNQQLSPNHIYEAVTSQNMQQNQGYSQQTFSQAPARSMTSYQGNDININEVNPSNLFMQSSQTTDQTLAQSSQNFMFSNQSDFSKGRNQPVTQSNQNFVYRNQSGFQNARDSYQSSSNSNSPPSLSVNTQQAQMTFRQMFQEPVPGPSNAPSQLDVSVKFFFHLFL